MNQDQKNGDISPAYIVNTSEVSEKRRKYKKYAIIAVSVVLVVAIVLAAILVGLYFFSGTQKKIIKFAFTRDDNAKEEVNSDPNTNVVNYHVNSNNYELWAFNDFNRDIQVLKIQLDRGTNCYVVPLNRTTARDPTKIVAPNGVNPSAPNTTYHVSYRTAKQPISDSAFLCKQARASCQGISTYWMYPTCDDAAAMEKRQKRGHIKISVSCGGVSVEIDIAW